MKELSGGERARIALLKLMLGGHNLLLLDEPVTGLDPIVTAELYELIASLNRQGLTVVMISHDVVEAVKHATHVLHISNTPLFFGEKNKYLQSDACKAYIK